MRNCFVRSSKKSTLENDNDEKSYLYKMRHVPTHQRGFAKDVKEKWKRFLDEMEKEIEQDCKEKIDNTKEVIQNKEDYDVVADLLHLPPIESKPRQTFDDSSDETVIGLPQRKNVMNRLDNIEQSFLDSMMSTGSQRSSASVIMQSRSSNSLSGNESERHDAQEIISNEFYEDEDYDIYVNPPTPPPEEDLEPWVDKRSPYQKFFSLAEYKATRWRRGFTESKPRELLTVQEREENLYNLIASDFCKWVAECQFQNVQLDETTITELFQVGMETPAVKAMCVQTKELPVVPAQVAQTFNMPMKSEMAGLRRQVEWDIKVAKLRESGVVDKPPWISGNKKTAVGCKQFKKIEAPRRSEALNKWISTNLLKKEEKSGEMLWAELERSRVFKQFCNWMIDNEKFKRPSYLEKKGYFKTKYNIDESDMVRLVRADTDMKGEATTVSSARQRLEKLMRYDKNYADILEKLVEKIPSLKAFLGYDVEEKLTKASLSKTKLDSVIKPLTQGMSVDSPDRNPTVHHMALYNHPEWP